MANINYDENSELHELGVSIITAEYPHLEEFGVEVRFRLSKKTPNLESDNYWGETRLFSNHYAFESQLGEAKTAKLNPPAFVCIDCMKWKPEKQRHSITIGADKRHFCIECAQKLSDEQRDNPGSDWLGVMIKRQERVDKKEHAGPPTYDSFFAIYMYEAVWKDVDDATKAAMLSTQLARCGASRDDDGEVKLKMLKPPVKLFPSVVETHGTRWWGKLDAVAQTIRKQGQLTLVDTSGEAMKDAKKASKAG